MKARLYKLAGILVSALFVYLAVRGVDFSESFEVLRDTRFEWLLAATLVYLSAFAVRGLRWRRILLDQKVLSFGEVMVPVLVGQMANNVLPARTGELYRAHFLGRWARMSRSGAVGSIMVERTFDGLMLVATILLVFFLFPETHFLGGVALAVGLAFTILAAGILFHSFATNGTRRVTDRLLDLLPRKLRGFVDRRLEAFLRGVRGLTTAGRSGGRCVHGTHLDDRGRSDRARAEVLRGFHNAGRFRARLRPGRSCHYPPFRSGLCRVVPVRLRPVFGSRGYLPGDSAGRLPRCPDRLLRVCDRHRYRPSLGRADECLEVAEPGGTRPYKRRTRIEGEKVG